MIKLLIEDFKTHGMNPLSQGFLAIINFRLCKSVLSLVPKHFRPPIYLFCRILTHLNEYITGITITPNTVLGRRVRIWHHSGIIINAKEIGSDVVIRQSTTIGQKDGDDGRPVIGSNVNIGCGAVILGNIFIGDNVVIGANSVVTKSVPSGMKVAGNPARILS